MSTSQIEICNLALSHIGSSDRIASLTEQTEPARLCNIMYEISREFVLQDFDWAFAERNELLALLDLTPTGYEYAYQYPSGCIQAKEIFQAVEGAAPIDFAVVTQESMLSKMVLTNEENARLVYTGDIKNTTMFTPAFVMAFSYQLASNIAIPITKKSSIKNAMLSYYSAYYDRAQVLDARQNRYTVQQTNDYLSARGYTG